LNGACVLRRGLVPRLRPSPFIIRHLPLENLDASLDQFRNIKSLLVCKSGARSHIAMEKLRKHGILDAWNLGPISRLADLKG
jgi:rhodanese-related sulfurtransferase